MHVRIDPARQNRQAAQIVVNRPSLSDRSRQSLSLRSRCECCAARWPLPSSTVLAAITMRLLGAGSCAGLRRVRTPTPRMLRKHRTIFGDRIIGFLLLNSELREEPSYTPVPSFSPGRRSCGSGGQFEISIGQSHLERSNCFAKAKQLRSRRTPTPRRTGNVPLQRFKPWLRADGALLGALRLPRPFASEDAISLRMTRRKSQIFQTNPLPKFSCMGSRKLYSSRQPEMTMPL